MTEIHPGFKAVAAKAAARQGIPIGQANAEIASAGRNASAKAKKKNPHLNKISGAKKWQPQD